MGFFFFRTIAGVSSRNFGHGELFEEKNVFMQGEPNGQKIAGILEGSDNAHLW